jgi:hypothetical protein
VDEPHLKTLHDLLDEAVALKEQTGKLVAEIRTKSIAPSSCTMTVGWMLFVRRLTGVASRVSNPSR